MTVQIPRPASLPEPTLSETGIEVSRYARIRDLVFGMLPELPSRLVVTNLEVKVADLPPALAGTRIMQISDLHIHPGQQERTYIRRIEDVLQRVQPDLVVNTGDFVTGMPEVWAIEAVVYRLLGARNPGITGPYNLAILGNHDYYTGPEYLHTLRQGVANSGVELLENRVTTVQRHAVPLTVGGITRHAPGFEQAVDAMLNSPRPRLLLVHEPDLAELLPEGIADLMVAGHTHGGQVALPGIEGWTTERFCGSRYVSGWYEVNGNRLYVNRGLGNSGVPFRFRAAPEVVVITLVT